MAMMSAATGTAYRATLLNPSQKGPCNKYVSDFSGNNKFITRHPNSHTGNVPCIRRNQSIPYTSPRNILLYLHPSCSPCRSRPRSVIAAVFQPAFSQGVTSNKLNSQSANWRISQLIMWQVVETDPIPAPLNRDIQLIRYLFHYHRE